uniref:Cytochrome c oxidase-assembly factor COX23, mitochondrial n=1 Tax=Blastobotrys adeninivorans TaxID=409370 RepID=A0A060T0E5_BLAAD
MSVERNKSKVDFTANGELRFYPDSPMEDEHKKVFRSKEPSQFYDPCAEASKMSLKCMERNDFDRNQCMEYFRAYRECKKEWVEGRKRDRMNGEKW